MITACPSCQRQFRIYAQQLSAAKGLVQCGFCGEQFNALDRLYDLPSPTSTDQQKKPGPATAHQEEPQFEIPGTTTDNNRFNEPQSAAGSISLNSIAEDKQDDIDLALLDPGPVSGSRITTVLWSCGAFMLLLVITAQIAWFNRDQLLSRYPQLVPVTKQLCERWQCDLIRERDLASIILVNRDVRDHPRYNETLLVNITIENQSNQTQPYPGIQFTLFDDNGEITAYRRLQASEYLDPEISIDEGFSPHVPLHVVLEVADTMASTVGFEFGFF